MRFQPALPVALLALLAAETVAADAVQSCYLNEITHAAPEVTVAEIRARCASTAGSAAIDGNAEGKEADPALSKKEEPVASSRSPPSDRAWIAATASPRISLTTCSLTACATIRTGPK